MKKDCEIKVKIEGAHLDRAMIYNFTICGKPVYFVICHNKQTSPIQFQIGYSSGLISSGEVKVSMSRNCANSVFCQTFFNLENLNVERYDYQNKFNGVNPTFIDELLQFQTEKMIFQPPTSNKTPNNYLLTLGWKIHGLEDDLVFYFIQRRCYNAITRMNIIRTASIQFATNKGLEYLEKYKNSSNREVPIIEDDEPVDTNKIFEDVE